MRLVVGPRAEPSPAYVDPLYEADAARNDYREVVLDGQPTPFAQRYNLEKNGIWWLLAFFLPLAFCTDGPDREPSDRQANTTESVTTGPGRLHPDIIAQYDALAEQLFGPGMQASRVATLNPSLARAIFTDPDDLAAAQEFVRPAILNARRSSSREDVLAITEVYLEWLRSAQAQGECREVTGRSFFDGIPFVSDEIAGREQALARRLLESGRLDYGEGAPRPSVFPDALLAQARAKTGLGDPALVSALADEADPNRCAVFIALVEAALENPAAVPTPELAAL